MRIKHNSENRTNEIQVWLLGDECGIIHARYAGAGAGLAVCPHLVLHLCSHICLHFLLHLCLHLKYSALGRLAGARQA